MQGASGGFEAESADEESGGDPTGGAENADRAELKLGVGHLAEGEGVGEGEGGHEAEAVEEEESVDFAEGYLLRGEEEEDAAEEMECGEDALGGEELVGDEADEEGRDHGADGGGACGKADLLTGEVERGGEPGADGDVPGSPDEVLEEHHCAEAYTDLHVHVRGFPSLAA